MRGCGGGGGGYGCDDVMCEMEGMVLGLLSQHNNNNNNSSNDDQDDDQDEGEGGDVRCVWSDPSSSHHYLVKWSPVHVDNISSSITERMHRGEVEEELVTIPLGSTVSGSDEGEWGWGEGNN